MAEYETGLTIHGVNWMCTGTLPEKVVWFIFIAIMFGLASYMIQGYVRRFLNFEYRTEIRYEEHQSITLPTMVFCSSLALDQLYSYYKETHLSGRPSPYMNKTKFTNMRYHSREYTKLDFITSRYIGNNCHVFNVNGTLKLSGKEQYWTVYFKSDFKTDDTLSIFPFAYDDYHSRSVNVPFTRDNKIVIHRGTYNIYLSQTHTSRLPRPFSSNCTDVFLTHNRFSTKYSESACYQQCYLSLMLLQCGDVTNIFKNLDFNKTLPLSKKTNEDRIKCFRKINGTCDCPFSCEKTEYDMRVQQLSNDKDFWILNIFNAESKVTHIHQVVDFTLEDLLGAAGGILGLTIGASSLSVLELCVYFVLFVFKKLY